MSGHRFEATGPSPAPEAWRAIDRALYRWVRAHGGSDLLARTAAWASLAAGQGDTALHLHAACGKPDRPAWSEADIAALRAEPMVAADDADTLRPFVLDAAGRFYLWRNRRDESLVLAAIRERRRTAQPQPAADADIAVLFDGRDDAAVAPQRAAVRAVAGRRLFVLTGGPGTGKTSTVVRMLLMLQRLAPAPVNIVAAAPTGKAAQRLAQALRDGRQALLAQGPIAAAPAWQASLAAVPDTACTLHRLLGIGSAGAQRRPAAALAADVVVVDEASMIDLATLRQLLAALRPDACLILVGDAEQLASVGAGSALMDLVSVLGSATGGDLVCLRHVFRAQRELAAIADAVRSGCAATFAAAWDTAGAAARRHHVDDTAALERQLAAWGDALAAAGPPPRLPGDGAAHLAAAALRTLTRRQLLCALRDGPYGAVAAAQRIERQLRRAWAVNDPDPWYHGRAVMVTRNDYHLDLFNGDVGLCLHDAQGRAQVWFEAAGDGGARACPPEQLPPHDNALAVTVHKSQGSEYDRVALLLPSLPDHPALHRQLLYTALSRARSAVELWSSDAALAAALTRNVARASGLAARLANP